MFKKTTSALLPALPHAPVKSHISQGKVAIRPSWERRTNVQTRDNVDPRVLNQTMNQLVKRTKIPNIAYKRIAKLAMETKRSRLDFLKLGSDLDLFDWISRISFPAVHLPISCRHTYENSLGVQEAFGNCTHTHISEDYNFHLILSNSDCFGDHGASKDCPAPYKPDAFAFDVLTFATLRDTVAWIKVTANVHQKNAPDMAKLGLAVSFYNSDTISADHMYAFPLETSSWFKVSPTVASNLLQTNSFARVRSFKHQILPLFLLPSKLRNLNLLHKIDSMIRQHLIVSSSGRIYIRDVRVSLADINTFHIAIDITKKTGWYMDDVKISLSTFLRFEHHGRVIVTNTIQGSWSYSYDWALLPVKKHVQKTTKEALETFQVELRKALGSAIAKAMTYNGHVLDAGTEGSIVLWGEECNIYLVGDVRAILGI